MSSVTATKGKSLPLLLLGLVIYRKAKFLGVPSSALRALERTYLFMPRIVAANLLVATKILLQRLQKHT